MRVMEAFEAPEKPRLGAAIPHSKLNLRDLDIQRSSFFFHWFIRYVPV